MKTAILAAGALAIATLSGGADASAKDVAFGLTIGGPNGFVAISSPGANAHAHVVKGHGYKGHNSYGYGYGYTGPYYGGPSYGYGHWTPRGGYGRPHNRPYRRHCMGPRQIRKMLRHRGWHGFRLEKLTSNIAVVYSNRHGTRYRIKVDRCNRAIIKVSPRGGVHPYGYY